MIITFKLIGEKARKYPDFLYRVPVMQKLTLARECCANSPCVKYNDYVNVEITTKQDSECEYLTLAIMSLIPNKYTQSNIKRDVVFARLNNISLKEKGAKGLMMELLEAAHIEATNI